ncbi:carbohydrate kinase family protein [Halobellus limi]|uniref:Carbohydrate kinase n=1 Tax=Halobellus limi TaxID=699433 RepID=A0A1H6CRD4_9EURY|nr:carbohydrate kinase [Halobellus limi]QCC49093.1 carbohydrate kinase [Halobellus limi]SEG75541.1 fructokinase [Halobellus limi]
MTERSILVAGEMLVDFIPATAGPLGEVESFDRRAGGAPANVAVALERLDERPWLCTNLSTDGFGDFLAATLEAEGVPDRFVTRSAHPTALAFVSHDRNGDRSFTFFREDTADMHIRTGGVDETALADAEWLVVGGVSLTDDPSRSAVIDLAERARDAGCRIVFDPNTRPDLWSEDSTRTLERMLSLTDVLKATPADFEPTNVPVDGETFGRRLLETGPDTVLVTRGAAGARAVAGPDAPWGAGEWSHGGYELDAVVDATGAGDAFLAGALSALVDGSGPEETLAFANAVAAVSTTESGAMAAVPNREAVEEFRTRQRG